MAKKLRDEDLVLNIIINGNKSKKEMQELERAITDTNKEIRQLKQQQKELAAQGKKETEAYRAATQAIKDKEAAITTAEARLAQLRKGMKLTEMTTGDLRREAQRLKKILDNTLESNPNYAKYKAQLEAVQGRLTELGTKAEKTGFNLKSMADKFNHYIGVVTAGIVTLMGLITGINKIVNTFAEFDDKVADVQKTTGLLKEDVLELNKELQQIDTRTSQENLLGLARVAGKLGISAKEDILGFVRASDQIGVALAEDLGGDVEEAINQVGKLVDIFDLKREFGIEQSLLKVGSAINELGAGSTANEGYLVNFTNRMAGVAPLAGITIDQILGLGATLDQFGQTAEVSSTALSKLFTKMSADAKTYSKYAGQSVDEFKKNLGTDFMGTFIKVLEGVKKSSGGINELVGTLGDLGLDGGRVVGVLGTLANNTEALKTQLNLANTSFKEGTSLTEEFAIKNETAAAKLDKAKKALYNLTVELGQKLYGAVTISTNGLTYLVKVLSVLIDFVIEHKKVLTIVIASLAAYNAVVLFQSKILGGNNIQKAASIALSKLEAFWNKAVTGSLHLLSAAYLLSKREIAAARAEMVLFNQVTKLNPIALLVSVLIAAGTAWYVYTQKLTAAQKAQQDLNEVKRQANDSIAEEKEKLNQLLSVINSETATRAQKLSAIKSIREIMPGYLQAYKDEEILAGKATTAVSLYVKEMERRATLEHLIKKRNDLSQQKQDLLEKQKGGYTGLGAWDQISTGAAAIVRGRTNKKQFEIDMKEQINAVDTSYEALGKRIEGLMSSVFDSSTSLGLQSQADYLVSELTKLEKSGKKGSEEYKKAWNEMKELNKLVVITKKKEAEEKKNSPTGNEKTDAELKKEAAEREKLRKTELAEENKANEQRLKDAGLFGMQRSLMTQDQLEQLAALEKIHQDNVNAINKKGQKVSLEQASQALAEIRKRQEAEHKYRLKLINPQSEEIEQENEAHAQRLEKAGLFGKQREQMTAEQLHALEILEATHRNKLDKIDADLIRKEVERKQIAFETKLADLRVRNNDELSEVTNIYQAKAILEKSLNANQLKEIKTLEQAKKAIKKTQLAEETKLTEEYAKDLLQKLKSAVESGEFEGINLSDKLLSDEEKKELEKKIRDISALLAKLKNPDEVEADGIKVLNDTQKKLDILGMSGEDWHILRQNLESGKLAIDDLKTAATGLASIWTSYNQIVANSESKQLKEFENSTNQKKQLLQQQLDKGIISQKKYNAGLEKLDAELDKKKAEHDRNAAVRERNVALMSAIVNTATAVTKALPNLFLAALVGAAGAMQIGTIVSTPLPTIPGKEEGGYVTRAQDGKTFKAKNQGKKRGFIDETSVLVSENGKEFVASAEAVGNPAVKEVLDVIDTAQKNGNVSTLTLEKMMYSSTPTRKIKGRENGGYISDDTRRPDPFGAGSIPPELIALLQQNNELYQKLIKQLENPIKAETVLLGKNGFIEKMNELTTTVENSTL